MQYYFCLASDPPPPPVVVRVAYYVRATRHLVLFSPSLFIDLRSLSFSAPRFLKSTLRSNKTTYYFRKVHNTCMYVCRVKYCVGAFRVPNSFLRLLREISWFFGFSYLINNSEIVSCCCCCCCMSFLWGPFSSSFARRPSGLLIVVGNLHTC